MRGREGGDNKGEGGGKEGIIGVRGEGGMEWEGRGRRG